MRIMWNGEVLRSMRLTIKATCPMNLANFPMDTQVQLTTNFFGARGRKSIQEYFGTLILIRTRPDWLILICKGLHSGDRELWLHHVRPEVCLGPGRHLGQDGQRCSTSTVQRPRTQVSRNRRAHFSGRYVYIEIV